MWWCSEVHPSIPPSIHARCLCQRREPVRQGSHRPTSSPHTASSQLHQHTSHTPSPSTHLTTPTPTPPPHHAITRLPNLNPAHQPYVQRRDHHHLPTHPINETRRRLKRVGRIIVSSSSQPPKGVELGWMIGSAVLVVGLSVAAALTTVFDWVL